MRTAILHFQDDVIFSQLSVFARILELDHECNLWLAVNQPLMSEVILPEDFDVLLNYYMEGVSFDLDILGKARVCTDEETIKQFSDNPNNENIKSCLLLKVELIDIDYWEYSMPVIKRIAKRLLQKFSSPLVENNVTINSRADQKFA